MVRVLGFASSMIWLPLQQAIFTLRQQWACAYCVFHVAVRDGLDLTHRCITECATHWVYVRQLSFSSVAVHTR